MKSSLKASELSKNIQAHPYVLFEGFGTDDESDPWTEPVEAASKNTLALTTEEFMNTYGVNRKVAERFSKYQSDLIGQLHTVIGTSLSLVPKYHQVSPYLKLKNLDTFLLQAYVEQEDTSREFDKKYNPRYFLIIRCIGLFISLLLNSLLFGIGTWHLFNVHLDSFGITLIVAVWFLSNILVCISTPKGYRTRKLIYSFRL